MVLLIQNTKNRDTEAVQVKLDVLVRATKDAHNAHLEPEERDEEISMPSEPNIKLWQQRMESSCGFRQRNAGTVNNQWESNPLIQPGLPAINSPNNPPAKRSGEDVRI